jgi:aminocarboxymuconate-semialdehyde decarboxylase
MGEAHIDFQVLSPSPLTYFHHIELAEALTFCRRHNDAMAELTRTYPDRLACRIADAGSNCSARRARPRRPRSWSLGRAIGTEFEEPLHSPKPIRSTRNWSS